MVLKQNTKHFLHRAAFGPSLFEKTNEVNISSWMRDSGESRPIRVIEKPQLTPEIINGSKENIKLALDKSRDQLVQLNRTWITQLTDPTVALCEKMTLFWHDHFACRVRSAYLAQQQNNTLRKHALGNFRDLLFAISKDPGMLQFLNNQQNKKDRPNENFAREILELFTLGRGNYTEQDIRNSARAFTGWSFHPLTGKFVFRDRVHDSGIKSFKGKNGRFYGEDILDIILEDKQTALFITEKIWQYFVSTDTREKDIINSLADTFFHSGYRLDTLLQEVFSGAWFYDPRFTGNRIKSPVELIVSLVTQTGGEFTNPHAPLFIQRALSQVLLLPPNVGGWPIGTAWIDSSSLMFRMSLPSLLLKNADTDFEAKDDGDTNNAVNVANAKKLGFKVDWDRLANLFVKHTLEKSLETIEDFLLARPATPANKNTIRQLTGRALTDAEFVQNAFIGFMSLPEYQLS